MDAEYLNIVYIEARQGPSRPSLLPTLSIPGIGTIPPPQLPGLTSTTSTTPTTSQSTTSTPTSTSTSTSTTSETSTTSTTTPVETTPTTTSTSTSSTTPLSTTVPQTTFTVTAPAHSPTTDAQANTTKAPTGFLQNKVLSGVVFSIVGLVGLVLIILIGTLVIRRRRNKRLIAEAVNFDPVKMGGNYADALEEGKREIRTSSSSSSNGKGHGDVSWTAMPAPGYQNQYNVSLQGTGQPYAPPATWATSARYAPPSQLYRPSDGGYPNGSRTQGY